MNQHVAVLEQNSTEQQEESARQGQPRTTSLVGRKILMLLENSDYCRDGRVRREACALRDAGCQVHVICPKRPEDPRSFVVDGVTVHPYRQVEYGTGFVAYVVEYGCAILSMIYRTLVLALRHRFDVVHAHNPPDLMFVVALLLRPLGTRFVYDQHDLAPEMYVARDPLKSKAIVYRALRLFEKMTVRLAHRVITANQSHRALLHQRCGKPLEQMLPVRNGPEPFHFRSAPPPTGLVTSRRIIGYVGVMGPQDGVDQLILALELLARRREQDDWQAILVGQGADKARLEQMTLQKGLQHRIRFVGWVPPTEVVSYIAAMDICAVPDPKNQYTDHSTLIKVMEYMAQRKPVVAFDLTETRYSLGEGGLYAHSVDEFSRAIGQLLDDGLLRNDLGQKGYDRAWKTLAWHRQVGNLIEIYRSLFEGDPAPMGSQGRPSLSRTSAILDRSSSESELGWRSPFPFPPALAAFLERSFVADKKNARLSHAYRMFYRLRPCVPATLRQALQRLNRTRSSESANPFMPGDLEEVLEQVGWNRSVWPEQANLALVLTHDVETSYGMSRIARLAEAEEKLGFRSCWNIVPYKYDIDLGLMRDLRERGFELGVHGYNHDGRLFFSKKIFDERVPGIHDASDRFQATGFRAPMVHRNLDWMQALDMEYDSSCFDLDPFQAMPGGVRTFWPFLYGRFVELPYTLPQDHTLFVVLGESTSRLWKEKLSMIRKWQGMALMLTHPDYLDSPSRLSMYLDFLKFLRDESTFWHVLPRDMARWVRQQ